MNRTALEVLANTSYQGMSQNNYWL